MKLLTILLAFMAISCVKTKYVSTVVEVPRNIHDTITVEKEVTKEVEVPCKTEPDIYTVYFNFDSAELTPQSKHTLNNIDKDRYSYFTIKGHACTIGDNVYNYNLGKKRGEVVFEKLGLLSENEGKVFSLGETESKSGPEYRKVEVLAHE